MTRPTRDKAAGRRSNRRAFRRWHRYCGMLVAVFLVVLAITGLILNHSAKLGLGSRHVQFAPLLAWYGIDSATEIKSFSLAGSWLSCIGTSSFLDRAPLPAAGSCPVGAVESSGLQVVATEQELLLLTATGELIERLGPTSGLPTSISAVGIGPGDAVVIDTPAGRQIADSELLQWRPLAAGTAVRWSRQAIAPPELRDELLHAYRGDGPTAERVVLDLHSGRLFGRWGPYVMDATAGLCLVLVISGLVLWRQDRRRDRSRRQR